MLKTTKHLLIGCLTIWTTCAQASREDRDEQIKQAHRDTIAAVSRFALPQQERPVVTELELMEKVYAQSDKTNADLQAMLANFRATYQTVSKFQEAMKKTVYDKGPQLGHMLIKEFSYVLMAYAQLKSPSGRNPLFDYYYSLVKTIGIRMIRPSYNEDENDMRSLSSNTSNVLSDIECLFDEDRNKMLSDALHRGRQYANGWVKENKLADALVLVEKDHVIINTPDIKRVQDMIPVCFSSLECLHSLNDDAVFSLLTRIARSEPTKLKLKLDNPSNVTLGAVEAFLRSKKLKQCEVKYSELCRMDINRYDSIKSLDQLLSDLNPDMSD